MISSRILRAYRLALRVKILGFKAVISDSLSTLLTSIP